ncbi:MAG: hypothetical protein HYV02_08125 [Deltaproteobacteria bacterium]|nr:hypothetical protein [Deltaproteobacteria bacterium]
MVVKTIGILYQPLGNPSPRNPYRLGVERMITAASAHGYESRVFIPAGVARESLPKGNCELVVCPTSFSGEGISDVVAAVTTYHRRTPLHRLFAEQECTVMLGALCRQAGEIPGLLPERALPFRNKHVMGRTAQTIGLHVPRSHPATSCSEIRAFAEKVGWPVIVKPIDGAGSDGIREIGSAAQLDRLWSIFAIDLARWRFEEYIAGIEYHVDTIVRGGGIVFVRLCRYLGHVLDFRTCPPASVIRLKNLSVGEQTILESDAGLLRAFGFTDGVSHNEYYVRNNEVIFGEAAARVGGGHAVQMIEAATGINLFDARIRLELDPSYMPVLVRNDEVGGQMLPARRAGRITSIIDTARLFEAGIFEVAHWFDVGDALAAATRSSRMFGYVLARGRDYTEIAKRLTVARDLFWVETDEESSDETVPQHTSPRGSTVGLG